jgi:hypothetical protein
MTSRLLTAAALSVFAFSGAQAQGNTDNQTVTFTVEAINEIAITGTVTLTINSATAGADPDAAQSTAATYAITTNETARKITAALDQAMPTGLTLNITLAAPTGATSVGAVSLSATEQDVVTGISNVAESALAITYDLEATAAAAVQAGTERIVTLTITATT